MRSLAAAILICVTLPVSLYAYLGESESQKNIEYESSHEYVRNWLPFSEHRREIYRIDPTEEE
jgi:hypothetical protein